MRKDYVADIDLESVNRILELACELGLEFESFEGCLLDSYVIHDTDKIKIGRVKPRKYIVIREKYLNAWSSISEMTMTDNVDFVNEFIENNKVDEEEEVA